MYGITMNYEIPIQVYTSLLNISVIYYYYKKFIHYHYIL